MTTSQIRCHFHYCREVFSSPITICFTSNDTESSINSIRHTHVMRHIVLSVVDGLKWFQVSPTCIWEMMSECRLFRYKACATYPRLKLEGAYATRTPCIGAWFSPSDEGGERREMNSLTWRAADDRFRRIRSDCCAQHYRDCIS